MKKKILSVALAFFPLIAFADVPQAVIGTPCTTQNIKLVTGAKIDLKEDQVTYGPMGCLLTDSEMYLLTDEKTGDLMASNYSEVRCEYFRGQLPSGGKIMVACKDKKIASLNIEWTGTEKMDAALEQRYGHPLKSTPMYKFQYKDKIVEKGMLGLGAKKVDTGVIKQYKGRFPNEYIFAKSFSTLGVLFEQIFYIDAKIVEKFVEYGKLLGPKQEAKKKEQDQKAKDGLL